MKVSGIIIAGGKSSRMGFDKTQILYRGNTFMQHAISLLAQFTDDILISYHKDTKFPYRVYTDEIPGTGPIGGLFTCLQHIQNSHAIVIPVDMPLLDAEVLNFLLKQSDNQKDINVFQSGNYPQMLVGLYHKNIVSVLKKQIERKDYKLQNLLQKSSYQFIPGDKFATRFMNVNSPGELSKLLQENGE